MRPGRGKRVLLGALAVLAAAAVPARAIDVGTPPPGGRKPKADFDLTVSAGLSDNCRMGWVPVHVKIDAARDFQGFLTASLRERQGMPPLFQVRLELELAAGSTTDHHLYIRHESPYLANATLDVCLEKKRNVRVEGTTRVRTLNLIDPEDYLVCVISAKRSVLGGLRAGNSGTGPNWQGLGQVASRKFYVAQPDLLALPEKAAGYNGVDFLVLHEAPFDDLASADLKMKAVGDYLRGGGKVIFSSGDRAWFSHAYVRRLIGAARVTETPRDEAKKLRDGLARRYLTGFGGGADGMVVHKISLPGFQEDGPRTVSGFLTGRRGLGTALVWRLDPQDAAMRSWQPGLFNLWGELASKNYRGRPSRDWRGSNTGWTTENNPVARARGRAEHLNMAQERSVSALLVVFLVVFYLVLVGPVNYFVLRRLDMRALSIVTIPLLSTVFVLLTFATGYLSRGVSTVGRRVTLSVACSGSGRADCVTYQSVFPAGSFIADLNTDRRGLLCPLLKPEMTREQGRVLATEDADGFALKDYPLVMWDMAYFQAQSTRSLGGAVRLVSIVDKKGKETGSFRVKNGTPDTLLDVFVVNSMIGEKYAWLDEIPPGASRDGQLIRYEEGSTAYSGGRGPPLKLQNALQLWIDGQLGAATRYEPPRREQAFAAQASRVVKTDPRLDDSRFVGGARLLLFARLERAPEPLDLDGRPVRGQGANVLMVIAEKGARP